MPHFKNERIAVEFSYPDNWDLSLTHEKIIIRAGFSDRRDQYNENITIETLPDAPKFTRLRDLMNILEYSFGLNNYDIDNFSKDITNMNLSDGRIANYSYTDDRHRKKMKGRIYVASLAGKTLSMRLRAVEEEFDNYTPIFDKIKKEIKII